MDFLKSSREPASRMCSPIDSATSHETFPTGGQARHQRARPILLSRTLWISWRMRDGISGCSELGKVNGILTKRGHLPVVSSPTSCLSMTDGPSSKEEERGGRAAWLNLVSTFMDSEVKRRRVSDLCWFSGRKLRERFQVVMLEYFPGRLTCDWMRTDRLHHRRATAQDR
jgi:hypothetical protein